MFSQKNVVSTMRAVKLRVEENQEETKRMMDCHFVIAPLTPELAADIDTGVAFHLFTTATARGTRAKVARRDILDAAFDLRIPRQTMTVRLSPEVKSGYDVQAVDVKKVRAKRGREDTDFGLYFTATFEMPGPDLLSRLAHQLNEPVALSFEKMQPPLPMDGDAA